jgi:hypothetical protein
LAILEDLLVVLDSQSLASLPIKSLTSALPYLLLNQESFLLIRFSPLKKFPDKLYLKFWTEFHTKIKWCRFFSTIRDD